MLAMDDWLWVWWTVTQNTLSGILRPDRLATKHRVWALTDQALALIRLAVVATHYTAMLVSGLSPTVALDWPFLLQLLEWERHACDAVLQSQAEVPDTVWRAVVGHRNMVETTCVFSRWRTGLLIKNTHEIVVDLKLFVKPMVFKKLMLMSE